MVRRPLASALSLAVFILVVSSLLPAHTVFAAPCPSGTVPIGGSRAAATAAGIPQSAECWNPQDKNAGQEAGDAKNWLRQHATQSANVSCLNADYAEKVKRLMQANPNGIPTITDGYRGLAAQAQAQASGASKVGPCGSYHQYGMAADFNNTSKDSLRWMRENAAQFGLAPVTNANPTTGCTGSGFCDYGHIQMGGPKPPANQCGACAGGEGGNGLLPNQPGTGGSSGAAPSGGGSGMGGMPQGGGGSASKGGSGLPDDMQPYKPTTPGSCDPGYSYINGQCHLTDVQCPAGTSPVQETGGAQDTSLAPTTMCQPIASSTRQNPLPSNSTVHIGLTDLRSPEPARQGVMYNASPLYGMNVFGYSASTPEQYSTGGPAGYSSLSVLGMPADTGTAAQDGMAWSGSALYGNVAGIGNGSAGAAPPANSSGNTVVLPQSATGHDTFGSEEPAAPSVRPPAQPNLFESAYELLRLRLAALLGTH